MADSIAAANTAAGTKKYKYIAPTPPSSLIDSTTLPIDFTARKFINIGLDPADSFNVTAHLTTPSRHVTMSADFLRRIFALMGNILSYVLEHPVKYKRSVFLETDSMRLSSMVYQGESVLVIENKNHDGCRVLLSRADLIVLQYMEWAIFELIGRKSSFVQPTVMQQFDHIRDYFINNFKREQNAEDMANTIKSVHDNIISNNIPKNTWNFVSQLKLYATKQLAEQCKIKIEYMEQEASISSAVSEEADADNSFEIQQPKLFDAPSYDIFNSYNSIQPLDYSPEHAPDVNDGPSYFDLRNSHRSTFKDLA